MRVFQRSCPTPAPSTATSAPARRASPPPTTRWSRPRSPVEASSSSRFSAWNRSATIAYTTAFDRRGGRVLVLVDHVLVERLGHQLLGLGVHPGGDERGEVQPRAAVEHQLVVDEPVGRGRLHGFRGQPQRRDQVGRQPSRVRQVRSTGSGTRRAAWFLLSQSAATAERMWARMRDAEVERRCRAWVGGRGVGRAGVHERGGGGRLDRAEPAASSAPMTPDSTSPDPAVAATTHRRG